MRKFLQHPITLFLTLILGFFVACQPQASTQQTPAQSPTASPTVSTPVAYVDRPLTASPAQLPPLPYDAGALSKAIDAETMRIHHDRHHQTYVDNLNTALKDQPNLQNLSIEAMLRDLNAVPENIRNTIRNNAGGHLNHTIFWQIMSPDGGGQPTGAIAQAINQTFGNFESFRKQFNEAGGDRFGSGWVWLVRNAQGQLQIVSTANQDNPMMEGNYPIMGNDVWEHAYYLRYQNRRADYLNNWWNVVNWNEINRRFQAASQQQARS
ncbi:superoxide dismutase [Leptolyngbya sp. GGD]|uniref:superoxide dismutase n=1 Tax=Leptolyngbya sp. GGD TaxID=2997907 RepID=UPI003FA3655C